MKELTGRTIGKYQIIERIGRGGTASVYKATDPDTGQIVAIKVLSPTAAHDENYVLRFQREFKMVTELRHPNIVPVMDYGSIGNSAFLVMPYFQNGSLADLLKERMLTSTEGARLINEISGALDFAHNHGIVHRDLKPGNILFDEYNKAILADFGMAHYHEASINITGSAVVGTPAYISPEQARGESIDHRTDQYAFGVILYQLVTNELPFEADTPIGVLIKHLNDPLPPPRTKNDKVPEIVERVILKATAKDRLDRFDSITEFNSVFQSALAHAIDPTTPAPYIELPEQVIHHSDLITKQLDIDGKDRRRKRRLAVLFATLAFLALFVPISAMAIMRYIDKSSSLADNASNAQEFIAEQTALAGTIAELSTELANRDEQLSDEEVLDAVMGTLNANQSVGEPGAPIETDDEIIGVTGLEFTPTPTINASSTSQGTYSFTPTESGGGSSATENTSTPEPSHTASATATFTDTPEVEPSATSTSTSTATPLPSNTPTNTPIPPTPTNTTPPITACSAIGFTPGSGASWSISNGGPADIFLTSISVTWAEENGNLTKIKLGGTIWTGSQPPTSATFSEGQLGHSNGRKILSETSKNLVFEFSNGGSVDSITVSFDNGDGGCVKND